MAQSTMSIRGNSSAQDLTQLLGDHHGYLLRMRMEGGLEGIELGPLLGKACLHTLPPSLPPFLVHLRSRRTALLVFWWCLQGAQMHRGAERLREIPTRHRVACKDEMAGERRCRGVSWSEVARRGCGSGRRVGARQGSYGRVYKGRWKGALVAIKVVEHNSSGGNADAIEGARESLLAASVSHPNVVACYKICTGSRRLPHTPLPHTPLPHNPLPDARMHARTHAQPAILSSPAVC